MNRLRQRLWEIVEVARPGDNLSFLFDVVILSLIVLNVLAVILGTVQSVYETYGAFLELFEIFSVIVFGIEYLMRLVACTVDSRYQHPILGRLRFAMTPMALIDLVAILPFFIAPMTSDMRVLRCFRLLRLLRLVKLLRYAEALRLFLRVISARRAELLLTSAVMVLLLIVASSLMYQVEHSAQPDAFPDIPSTMWWAVATLTTVGYGDVYPITGLGRVLASVVAILGIGLFALPTGILGSGFVEEIGNSRKTKPPEHCPHCGESLD